VQTIETQILLPFEETNLRGDYRDYFVIKRSNYFTTIHTFSRLWNCYLGLDEIWVREFSDLQRITQPGQALPIKLFSNCHAQFRVAFELGFSTCIAEAWNIVRSSIETAAQAHKIWREPKLASVWAKKDDGPQEAKTYKAAFETHKKESLFPVEHGLRELYSYYGDYSELGTHPTISALALRHNIEVDDKDMSWRHEYLETKPERMASFLFTMLTACALVEKAFCDCFDSRLKLDPVLLKMREVFVVQRHQTADWILREFNFDQYRADLEKQIALGESLRLSKKAP
jgi:hypothetical protein